MTDPTKVYCTEGGVRHRVDSDVLEAARSRALRESGDGSYTVSCKDCGKAITKGPRDLTFQAEIQ